MPVFSGLHHGGTTRAKADRSFTNIPFVFNFTGCKSFQIILRLIPQCSNIISTYALVFKNKKTCLFLRQFKMENFLFLKTLTNTHSKAVSVTLPQKVTFHYNTGLSQFSVCLISHIFRYLSNGQNYWVQAGIPVHSENLPAD